MGHTYPGKVQGRSARKHFQTDERQSIRYETNRPPDETTVALRCILASGTNVAGEPEAFSRPRRRRAWPRIRRDSRYPDGQIDRSRAPRKSHLRTLA